MSFDLVKSNRRICPFGGINFVKKVIHDNGLPELIDCVLGERAKQAKFSHSDVLLAWLYSTMCGATRLEDAHKAKRDFAGIPDLKIPSPDTFGRTIRSFATKDESMMSKNENEYAFNTNPKLQKLLVFLIKKLKILRSKDHHVLDYDNTIIHTKKYDAKKTYLMERGYQPGVSFIDKIPIYVEGRSGNAAAKFKIDESVIRAFEFIEEEGIKVGSFRSDSAAYNHKLIHYLNKRNVDFFIRITNHPALERKCADIRHWKNYIINDRPAELASIDFDLDDETFRVVVKRTWDPENGHLDLGIITNNLEMSEKEVLQFYNQRGSTEKRFSELKRGFNWDKLPFSFLNENTAFMLIGAIGYVIYRHCLNFFAHKTALVSRTWELKRFRFLFLAISAEWKRSRLILYGDNLNQYEVLKE